MQLSLRQQKAVYSPVPQLVVHACPEAGKTTVLTERLTRRGFLGDRRRRMQISPVTPVPSGYRKGGQ